MVLLLYFIVRIEIYYNIMGTPKVVNNNYRYRRIGNVGNFASGE